MAFSRTDCARARESVSAELDGELPELELEWQRAHLRVCADCAAWAEQVQGTTQWLREASLEEPVAGFALSHSSRRWRVNPAFAVASAAAVAASFVIGLGTQRGTLDGGGSQRSQQSGPQFAASTTPLSVQQRRLGLDSHASNTSASATHSKFRAV